MNVSSLSRLTLALFCLVAVARAANPPGPAQLLEFQVREAGETKKLALILTPEKIRVDQPDDKVAAIYEASNEKFTGLELRDGTYWEFSWPEIQATIQKSKRYERRFHDLNIEGLASYDLTRPDPVDVVPDAPIYQWRPTGEKRRIGAYETAQWLGTSATAPPVEAWCVENQLAGLKPALDQVKKINEPMALVPVRPILPAIAFLVVDSLFKAQVVPVEIDWGQSTDRNRLTLVKLESKNVDSKSFSVPNTYRKVQLNALDGILENNSNGQDTKNQPVH